MHLYYCYHFIVTNKAVANTFFVNINLLSPPSYQATRCVHIHMGKAKAESNCEEHVPVLVLAPKLIHNL